MKTTTGSGLASLTTTQAIVAKNIPQIGFFILFCTLYVAKSGPSKPNVVGKMGETLGEPLETLWFALFNAENEFGR